MSTAGTPYTAMYCPPACPGGLENLLLNARVLFLNRYYGILYLEWSNLLKGPTSLPRQFTLEFYY